APVVGGRLRATFEWVRAQIIQVWNAEALKAFSPDIETGVVLLDEGDLPLRDTHCKQVTVVAPVKKFFARRLLHITFEEGHQVISVEMDFESFPADRVTFGALGNDIRITCRRAKGRQKILVRAHIVDNGSRLDHTRPADQAWSPVSALPISCLLT